jgi:hypothetical protein
MTTPRLEALGDELHRAAQADLAATVRAATHRRRRRFAAAAACIVVIPAAAYAADQLITTDEVAKSVPAGTLALAGTEPTCTVEKENVQFHCTLKHAPAPEVSNWKGTVEPTVDATKHVNGGCRGLTADGREWRCYIGQAAVDEEIIGPDFLGEIAPSPGQG